MEHSILKKNDIGIILEGHVVVLNKQFL